MLVLLPSKVQPVEPLQLVGVQLTPAQEGGIAAELASTQLTPCCRARAAGLAAAGLQ